MWEEEASWKVGESVEEHLICFKDEATIGGKRKQIVQNKPEKISKKKMSASLLAE